MELAPYVDDLRHQLLVAAEAGGDDTRAVAERLTAALESAARLVLLDALSAAASEITSELAPGSVDVRLRGRDPDFVVTKPPSEQSFAAACAPESGTPARPAATPDADEGGTARLTLRLGEQLKARIEAAAAADQVSVNSWLVRLATAALDPREPGTARPTGISPPSSGQRFTGWAR